ncbi:hypothetical protein GPECTOR_22g815 [Gonium pectorale]|uniref:ABM domain-containing protein n=1 Tax=Gonium pectorale TaxID=33097 RepID=A0A150GHC2_GONPE|nr:hypothetical protein GPECTOR_22g815 [Gonium pectorale]|eukprot:KXZ49224.1 hypothetical protein GPECTOR_22g815 [Gonium pectorale]
MRRRRRAVALAARGSPNGNGADDPLKNLDLKNLNDLPLSKLSETANAVWERIRASGINVNVKPGPSPLMPGSMTPGKAPGEIAQIPMNNGNVRPAEKLADMPSSMGNGNGNGNGAALAGKEQRLMAALAQVQEEKRELSERAELLRANLSMLEARNVRLVREVEAAEGGRENALRLRDVLLEERDSLAGQLKQTQEQLQRVASEMASRENALEALRQSQQQLQEELRDAVSRLQAVDKSTEELRSQLSALESSRSSAVTERDSLATHLQELMGMVEQLGGLVESAPEAIRSPPAAGASTEGGDAGAGSSSPVSTARSQLEALRSTTEGAFAALEGARQEMGLLRAENQQLAQRAEALKSSNAELASVADSLRRQVAEAAAALDAQRQEAAEARQAAAKLETELAASNAERSAAQAAVAEAVAERDALAEAVAQLSAIKDAAAVAGLGLVELAQMSGKINTLQEQLTASRASEKDLKRRLAATEVALIDARREAAANEARLTSQLEAARADADQLRSALRARTLATQAARRAGVPPATAGAEGPGQFVNTNRFWVPADLMFDFVKAVAAREVALVDASGFLGISVRSEELNVMTVSTQWESIPAFEAWSCSADARRHHLPSGVYQYVPRRGEGFPEDYIPFKDLNEAVNAKY